MNFAIQEYGWGIQHTLDAPIILLMLLMRQKLAIEGKQGLSLTDQEKLDRIGNDKTAWDRLIEENRRQLMRNMQ